MLCLFFSRLYPRNNLKRLRNSSNARRRYCNNNLDVDTIFIPANGDMCSVKDNNGKETVSANHFFGLQLSAKAHYRVNYGYAVIVSIIEKKRRF